MGSAAIGKPLPVEHSAAPVTQQLDRGQYRSMGYTGDMCTNPDCGSMRMRHNGTCLVCEACGQSSGCS